MVYEKGASKLISSPEFPLSDEKESAIFAEME
jgi:hypothetical protein